VADLQVRELTELTDFAAVARLFDTIWTPDPAAGLATADLLRALSKAGNYVAGAFDGELMIGAAMGFFGPPRERLLHSHIAGATVTRRGVGYALKLHQRQWALDRGTTTIEWTYDPLVSRNAYFNLAKLGAVPVEYLPNFYGAMNDGINAGDETDRLLVHWDLTAPIGAPIPDRGGAVIALDRTPSGRPAPAELPGGGTVRVAVPQDIEQLRTKDPAAAREWRLAVRSVLAPLLAGGARVTGFDRSGFYVVSIGEYVVSIEEEP
jgi:predicted GNAT superfamily acetyltransferase